MKAFVIYRDGNLYSSVLRSFNQPSLPGGTINPGESPEDAAKRNAAIDGWEVDGLKPIYEDRDAFYFSATFGKMIKENVNACWSNLNHLAIKTYNIECKCYFQGEEFSSKLGEVRGYGTRMNTKHGIQYCLDDTVLTIWPMYEHNLDAIRKYA